MKRKNGFSLIELIIAISILGLLTGVFVDAYIKSKNNFDTARSQNMLNENTRTSLDITINWIKKSSSVISSYTAPDNSSYTASSQTAILKIPSIDGSQNIIADKYDYVIFRPDPANSKLLRELIYPDAASSRTIANRVINQNLYSFQAIYYDSGGNTLSQNYEQTKYIKVTINSQEVIRGKTNQVELNSKVKLRNK